MIFSGFFVNAFRKMEKKELKNKTLIFRALFLASVIVVLTGCTGPGSEPEQPLDERVLARWSHMIERDFEAAWDYYSPGFRQTNPREDFARDMERRPVRWHEAEVVELSCDEDRCDVTVRITYQAAGAPAGMGRMRIPRELEEQWIRLDGQWWYSSN